ncbi:MAG TPA: methyltransferase domain-containing protein [Bryobacteraceae bacterium]|jgi:tRNA (mo5U34)-methyltransferase|nr:methyltransferase domain-containing protein [Bryobacteraceae bacterium]
MERGTFSYVRGWKREFEAKGWWHSFDLPGGRHIDGVCTVDGLRKRLEQFPIPEDLRGARVLDIGAWDGWYTFEMERRGADVVAVDCWDNPRFHQIHAAMNSRAEYRQMDVYELTPATVGRFDIVLFMGVLYHLKHPLLALERVCAITRDLAVVDSFILREEHRPGENVENHPVMEFYENEEFGGQTDNWCGPSLPCLMAMCRTAGFARVEHRATLPNGACIACFRAWEPEPVVKAEAAELLDAVHHTNFGINFQSRYDEYVLASFRPPVFELMGDHVKPQVGEFGVLPIHVSKSETGVWRAKFKLPPGLEPGWHDVSVRLGSGVSNPKRIAVDVPLTASKPGISGLRDGTSWKPGVLDLSRGSVLTAWVEGLPENADRANVRAVLGGEALPVDFVSPGISDAPRQVNIEVPAEVPDGDLEVEILVGSIRSAPAEVRITR